MKNSNDTIGNRTRELPAVPQPTAHTACPKQHSRYTKCTLSCVPVRFELPNVQSFYELRTKNAYNVGANHSDFYWSMSSVIKHVG